MPPADRRAGAETGFPISALGLADEAIDVRESVANQRRSGTLVAAFRNPNVMDAGIFAVLAFNCDNIHNRRIRLTCHMHRVRGYDVRVIPCKARAGGTVGWPDRRTATVRIPGS